MRVFVSIFANRIVALLFQAGAQFDPELLQWPGGSLIALILILRTTAASAFDHVELCTSLQKAS